MTIVQWFKDRKWSTHAIVAMLLTFFGLYYGNAEVKSIVDIVLKDHPSLALAMKLAGPIYLAYKGSHTAEGSAKEAAKQGVTAQIENPVSATSEPVIVVSTQPAPIPPVETVKAGGKNGGTP